MARKSPKSGLPLFRYREDRGQWEVRFSHEGKRYQRLCGPKERAAKRDGTTFWNDVIRGRHMPAIEESSKVSFAKVCALFLASIANDVSEATLGIYTGYGRTFVRFFRTLGHFTSSGLRDYQTQRLSEVKRETLTKERSVINRFGEAGHSQVPAEGSRAAAARRRPWARRTRSGGAPAPRR